MKDIWMKTVVRPHASTQEHGLWKVVDAYKVYVNDVPPNMRWNLSCIPKGSGRREEDSFIFGAWDVDIVEYDGRPYTLPVKPRTGADWVGKQVIVETIRDTATHASYRELRDLVKRGVHFTVEHAEGSTLWISHMEYAGNIGIHVSGVRMVGLFDIPRPKASGPKVPVAQAPVIQAPVIRKDTRQQRNRSVDI